MLKLSASDMASIELVAATLLFEVTHSDSDSFIKGVWVEWLDGLESLLAKSQAPQELGAHAAL